MGKKDKKHNSSSSSASESDEEDKKKKKKTKKKEEEKKEEKKSIMPLIVIIVILAALGGAIFAIIKFIAPADEDVDEDSGATVFGNDFGPTVSGAFESDRYVPVVQTDDDGTGSLNPSSKETQETPIKYSKTVLERYPSGACKPINRNQVAVDTYEWDKEEPITNYCIYNMVDDSDPEGGQSWAHMDGHGAQHLCHYFMTPLKVETYDDAKKQCYNLGFILAMFETAHELCNIVQWLQKRFKVIESSQWYKNHGKHNTRENVKEIWVAGEAWHQILDAHGNLGRPAFKGIGENPHTEGKRLVGPFRMPSAEGRTLGVNDRAALNLDQKQFTFADKNKKNFYLCKKCLTSDISKCAPINVCEKILYPDYCDYGRKNPYWFRPIMNITD